MLLLERGQGGRGGCLALLMGHGSGLRRGRGAGAVGGHGAGGGLLGGADLRRWEEFEPTKADLDELRGRCVARIQAAIESMREVKS
mgnify:CR=1 FL=1